MSAPVNPLAVDVNYRVGNWEHVWGTLEFIETHFDEYYQGAWCIPGSEPDHATDYACKTTRCVAGWLAARAGWKEVPSTYGGGGIMDAVRDGVRARIELAALHSMELNPTYFPLPPLGRADDDCTCDECVPDVDENEAVAELTKLFGASRKWSDLLRDFRSLAVQDEVEVPGWVSPAIERAEHWEMAQ